MSYENKRRKFRSLTFLALSALIILYYFRTDPATDTSGIPCLFHKLTGWNCWGCGGQRAFHQLLHGNLGKAASLNLLIFPIVALGCYVFLAELIQEEPSYRLLRQKIVQIGTLVLLLGFTLLRNII